MLTCEGKIAVVTGAAGGIGLATAKKLVEEGALVYAMDYRVDAMEKNMAGWDVIGSGKIVRMLYFDAWELDSIRTAIEDIYKETSCIDIFINNAIAGQGVGAVDNTTVADTGRETIMNLYKGVIGVTAECMRVVIPLMIKSGGGSIVNVSSLTGVQADMTRSYYGAVKSSVNLITKDTALQYGRQGIRCNAVLPGFTVASSTLEVLPSDFTEQWLKHTPIRRLGKPEDQANAIVFFAGSQSEWITGQCLEVSGGHGIGTPLYGDIVEPTK